MNPDSTPPGRPVSFSVVKRAAASSAVRSVPPTADAAALRWARKLAAGVEAVMDRNPEADRENVRHTLILLQEKPWQRLERSLRRGRATPVLAR